MLITDEYKKLNASLHKTNEKYGNSGILYAKDVMQLCFKHESQDVLDYGCGKSTLANNLPFAIKQYDPAIPAHAALPHRADIVVCTDVMEHIEPECLEDVLAHIASLTKKCAFLVIANGEAEKFLEDGRNAHLIQENGCWWHNKISATLEVISFYKKGSKIKKNGKLFIEYAFICQPHGMETNNEQV